MSTAVWVPLLTAGVGLIAGLVSGLGGTILSQRRASKDRLDQWQREDSLRWQQDRLRIYGQLISALDAWDAELRTATARRKVAAITGEPPSFNDDEWQRLRRATSDVLALVELMAPEEVRGTARSCYVSRDWIRMGYLTEDNADLDEMEADSDRAQALARALVEAMRSDLGLGMQASTNIAPRPTPSAQPWLLLPPDPLPSRR